MTGSGHPERPARLKAVHSASERLIADEAVTPLAARRATTEELTRVHTADHVHTIESFCAAGGGNLDPDTPAVPASFEAAVFAAGAGLTAIQALRAGDADAAFCAVRPPGHHATPARAMGFCLLNNVAITAATLADQGERVLILDWDAHHGNGTQDAFYDDPRVLYASIHQFPFYPGTGAAQDIGSGDGAGFTVNVPLPAHATGDVCRRAVEDVVIPVAERFEPTWVLLSAGFDGHHRDPLTELSFGSGDYSSLTSLAVGLVPAGRRIAFLEGGYDLDALADSTGACLGALAGVDVQTGPSTNGGPGHEIIDSVRRMHDID